MQRQVNHTSRILKWYSHDTWSLGKGNVPCSAWIASDGSHGIGTRGGLITHLDGGGLPGAISHLDPTFP
ncbi:hypothetical protein NL676_000409 [Syzygium grande]|nr:hypothetical protein NL676_000409 [Syzygium grande]